ncbi:MAG: cache domain-containing protein [Eubacterium sp.]|nr:cache domain-containing protein [Eubacterium sp.]
MGENKHNRKLVSKVIYIAIGAVVVVAATLTVFSAFKTSTAYHETVEEMLKVACEQLQSEMSSVWDGDWSAQDDHLFKGEQDVTEEYEKILDNLNGQTGLQYTLFFGDTRYVTTTKDETGKKTTGTKASEKVISEVLTGGQEYFATNVDIGGTKYFAYYAPMTNSDGKVAGMVFAGRPSEDVEGEVRGVIIFMIILAVGLVAVMAIAGLLVAARVSRMMKNVAGELDELSRGKLDLNIEEAAIARKDEVGMIAEGARNLSEQLGHVIRTTKDMSDEIQSAGASLSNSSVQAYEASGQITKAVDDISNGAISQAESMQDAANNTDTIAENIEIISANVNELDTSSSDMKHACEQAMEALGKLIESSNEVQESVREIGETITSTNKSAEAISEFTQAINAIATQTNLLSLNASIEAARAGEAGKGFAVVAGEIGGLAEQSSNSADEIKKIVDQLVSDSSRSVEVLQKLNESFETQSEQMNGTRENMEGMVSNVDIVAKNSESIASRIDGLRDAKNQLESIISDLSAISEENAAASEQTNASMAELNNTFAIISDEAGKLESMATELTDTISYFNG